jgi:pimeloyl-ACP methyl ester carboxylesterase
MADTGAGKVATKRRPPGIRRLLVATMLDATATSTDTSAAMTQLLTLPAPPLARRTLVALHCSGSGGRAFDGYRPLLGRDTEFVAPDLLGYGSGERWPIGGAASFDDEANQLAALLARYDGGVHLLGHSYGGAVALQVALRWPRQVRSLTVYEPVRFALLHADPVLWANIVGVGRNISALALAGREDEAAEMFVDYWSYPGAWASLSPTRKAAVAARMSKVQAEFEAAYSDPLPSTAYAGLSMPVTVLVGGQSPEPARRVAERLVEACPQARLVRVPHHGHMGALENPKAVLRELPWMQPALAEAA